MTGAALADDNTRNRQQSKEKAVHAPSPDGAVPPAPPPAADGHAAGGPAAARETGGRQPAAPRQSAGGAASAARTPARIAKDIGLFLVAPYVTLAYLAMFPYLGMKLLAQMWRERKAAG